MSSLKNKTLPILLISILACTALLTLNSLNVKAANVLNVPSASYPTIQSALNAANDGDTIKVASGTYIENINYTGYSIAVATGASGPKVGVTLQGETGTTINGNVVLTFLRQIKVDSLMITGSLTLGDSGMYGYVVNSTISNVQVTLGTTIGGFYNTLTGCTFNGGLTLKGGNGKWEAPSYQTTITNNEIKKGLTIKRGSDKNIIQANVISDGAVGIFEEASTMYSPTGRNQIINNTIANNGVGLSLYSSTGDNQAPSHEADKIVQNIIKNNNVGIEISATAHYPFGNTLYYNDFINNGVQVRVNSPVTNVWDDGQSPRKGNYWSDYKGSDSNGDGIGDTPYVINAENQDNFPLMRAWSAPNPAPNPSPTPTGSQSPAPSTSPANPLTASSPTPPQSSNPTSSNTPANTDPSQTKTSIVPELTPFMAIAALVAVSLLTILLKHKHSSTF